MTIIRHLLGEPSPQDLLAKADLDWVRASCPSGTKMSPEMEMLLALVIFDGYKLFPSECERERSKYAGGR